MGSVCLSSASILRCTSLTQLQNILLVVPTALEVVFSTSLIFTKRNRGWKYLLLTAEGWTYLTLSVMELLSNVIPAVRGNIAAFQAFDTGIGVSSFLPVFFYTFFFFLFASSELLDTLPKRIGNVAKYSLVLFIPAIVIFNEIASFTGVVIRKTTLPDAPANSELFIQFFFADKRADLLWAFFTSLTLALLTAFQAAVFCFAFFRLVRAILNQRRIENKGSDKAHFFKGIAWLCAALKIGALESLVGLFGGGFDISLTRRIMRMASRACLCVGVVKGVDVVEDFRVIQRELRTSNENRREPRLSRILQLVSNPRASTFRRLSATATSFHASTRAVENLVSIEKEKSAPGQQPHYITFSRRQSQQTILDGLPGMKGFAAVKEERLKQRVTILQYQESAPKLHMRFSTLDVPSPAVIVDSVKSRPQSEWIAEPVQSKTPYQSGVDTEYMYNEKDVEIAPPLPRFHGGVAGSDRDSYNSLVSSRYEIVDARKLPQTLAVGQLYQAPTVDYPARTADAAAVMAFPEPTYQSAPLPRIRSQDTEASRIKSMASTNSKANSITAAVRDLADQFPGPPVVSQIRAIAENGTISKAPLAFVAPRVEEKSVWEEDSRTSAQYISGGDVRSQALGSPSELTFGRRSLQSSTLGMSVENDFVYGSGSEGSALASAGLSPVQGGKVPVTRADYRASIASRKSKRSEKVIDPFGGDEESSQLAKTPVTAPLGMPLRQSLQLSVAATPVPVVQRPLDSPDNATPTTGLSGFSRLRESVTSKRADPFLDLGTALDTGKSRQFRPNMPPLPQAPMSARGKFKSDEKLFRIAEWVDNSANVAVAREQIDPEQPVTQEELKARPAIQGPRDNSLQNLHDRGKSIDALTIRWMKGPQLSAAEARVAGRTNASYESSAMRTSNSRIKTVGRAPSRATPAPLHIAHTRGSLYLEPIIIPPRNGNMPQIEYASSVEMEVEERNVLKDSEVLVIESVMGARKSVGRF